MQVTAGIMEKITSKSQYYIRRW